MRPKRLDRPPDVLADQLLVAPAAKSPPVPLPSLSNASPTRPRWRSLARTGSSRCSPSPPLMTALNQQSRRSSRPSPVTADTAHMCQAAHLASGPVTQVAFARARPLRSAVGDQVDLVADDDRASPIETMDELAVSVVPGTGDVEHRKHQIRLLHGPHRTLHPQPLDVIAPARIPAVSTRWMGIPPISMSSSTVSRVVPGISDTIARSRMSSAFSKRALADVWLAHDGGAHALLQCPAHERRAQQPLQIACAVSSPSPRPAQSSASTSSSEKSTVASIWARRPTRARLTAAQPLRQPTLQLPHRRPQRPGAPSGHDGGHALRLGQVDPSVQKRPPGELPRLGESSPETHEQPQHRPLRGHPAVAVHFDDILARVRVRASHDGQQNLVDVLPVSGIDDMPVQKTIRLVGLQSRAPRRPEHRLGDADRLRAAHPHDPDGPHPGGGRQRHDGVLAPRGDLEAGRSRPRGAASSRASSGLCDRGCRRASV